MDLEMKLIDGDTTTVEGIEDGVDDDGFTEIDLGNATTATATVLKRESKNPLRGSTPTRQATKGKATRSGLDGSGVESGLVGELKSGLMEDRRPLVAIAAALVMLVIVLAVISILDGTALTGSERNDVSTTLSVVTNVTAATFDHNTTVYSTSPGTLGNITFTDTSASTVPIVFPVSPSIATVSSVDVPPESMLGLGDEKTLANSVAVNEGSESGSLALS